MHPLLIKIGPFPIYTYGFMIAMGFLGGTLLNRSLAKRCGLDTNQILDLTFWGMMVGLIGARALFVITRLPYFLQDPLAVFRVWEGGLVFWGAPIAVVLWGIWYLKRHRMPFWKTADVVVHGLVVGHILGRFGCVGAGCCYGKPTGTDFGIKLHSNLVDAHLRGVPLHPVQLYEAGALAVLLVGMLAVFRRKVFDGQVFLTYFIAYPIIRSIVEIYRGDLIRGFVIDGLLSTSQFISLVIFLVATTALVWRLKAVRTEGAGVRAT